MSDVEYIVNFGSDRSIQFVKLSMAEVEHHGAKLGEGIVRCRDCRHAIDNGAEGNADYCGRPDGDGGYLLFGVEPDGFCKWGERKEDA